MTGRSINGAANASQMGYDMLGRLNSATNPLGAFTYNYVGVTGRMDHVNLPDGQVTQFGYFGAGGSRRLQEIKHLGADSTVISQFDCTYDAGGNIATWTQANSGLAHARQFVFGHDAADQLTSGTLTDTVTNATLRVQGYRYDAAGNRVTVQNNNAVTTETPNGLNQITQAAGGGMMRFAGTLSKQGTCLLYTSDAADE